MFCNYFSDACFAILNLFSLWAQTLLLIASKAAIKNPQNIPQVCTDTLEARSPHQHAKKGNADKDWI